MKRNRGNGFFLPVNEPLAEDHVVILCQARERTDHEFSVRNNSNRDTTFEVESDILHISGPSHVRAVPLPDLLLSGFG